MTVIQKLIRHQSSEWSGPSDIDNIGNRGMLCYTTVLRDEEIMRVATRASSENDKFGAEHSRPVRVCCSSSVVLFGHQTDRH